jgi:hypothetical protein
MFHLKTFYSAWIILWVPQTLWEYFTILSSSLNLRLSWGLWIVDILYRCTPFFFLQYLRNAENLICSWSFTPKCILIISNNFHLYMDLTVREGYSIVWQVSTPNRVIIQTFTVEIFIAVWNCKSNITLQFAIVFVSFSTTFFTNTL